jgi:phage I-like protein
MGFLDAIQDLFRNRDGTPTPPDGAYRNAVSLPGDLDDAPDWIRVVPIGDFLNHPDGAHEVTSEHIDQMVENFDRKDVDLLFDVDHESLVGNTRAAAWGMELEARDDGLYARFPNFTPYGEELVTNQEYRYLSPVYALDVTDKQGEQVGARLFSVAITNTPYFDAGEIDAINASDSAQDSHPSATPDTDPDSIMDRDTLIDLLGLGEDATDEEIQVGEGVLRKAKKVLEGEVDLGDDGEDEGGDQAATAQADDPESGDPEGDEEELEEVVNSLRTEINELKKEREEDRAEQLVNSAIDAGKIAPSQEDIYLSAARADYEGTKEKLEAMEEGAAMPSSVDPPAAGDNDGRDDLIANTAAQVKAERGA